jgi:hypothetical protein
VPNGKQTDICETAPLMRSGRRCSVEHAFYAFRFMPLYSAPSFMGWSCPQRSVQTHRGRPMTLLGLFGKKLPINWATVTGQIAGLLLTLLSTDPKLLGSTYARIVVRKDGRVFLATDKRDPRYILGWGDLNFVFLREDRAALETWINDLKTATSPLFQQIATEEFAKILTRSLMADSRG